jgi:hypothetical protein
MRRALVPEAEIVPIAEQAPVKPTEIYPAGYRKKFVSCRAQGHEWTHITGLADHPHFKYIKGLVSECLGCGLVRYRWVLSNGRRFGLKYEYPEGYQVTTKAYPELIRRPTQNEWRAKHVRTLGFREERHPHDEIEARRKGKS